MKQTCYYAHPMITYNSIIEKSDIILLERLGFKVINPNCKEISEGLKEFLKHNSKEKVMEYFANIVQTCDAIAFRALPDGRILSGCAVELERAILINIPIIELPRLLESRFITYPETKEYLTEIGFYKNLK